MTSYYYPPGSRRSARLSKQVSKFKEERKRRQAQKALDDNEDGADNAGNADGNFDFDDDDEIDFWEKIKTFTDRPKRWEQTYVRVNLF